MGIKKENYERYKEHLFNKTTDGFIQVFKLDNGKAITIYAEPDGLNTVLEEVSEQKDTFITPNTMFIPKRRVEYVRQFRALYIDIDKCEGNQVLNTYKVLELAEKGKIPKPSMVVDSGRGIHLYWRIQNAPYGALHTWQELQDYLYFNLKSLGADAKATDAARVLRIPGTINSRNNMECRVIYQDDELEYSMYDLREKYLKSTKKQLEMLQVKKKSSNRVITNAFFNSYSLHMARAEDIETLCKLRNYKVKGYRNMILHCYAYWRGLIVRDLDELGKEVHDLNNSFTQPLKENDVDAILRCVPKAIDKFIDYEVAMKNELMEKPKKGDKDKKGYWYKNSTLIDRLDITDKEQKHLKTIIDSKEKYRRRRDSDKEYQKTKRRNEEGLTKKQAQLRNEEVEVKKLRRQGLSMQKIADKLGISKAKVVKLANL